MNKVELVGRLVRNPELKYSQGIEKVAIAAFTVACDRRHKKEGEEQTADFISCKAFGKTAEFLERYFTKGQRIGLTGRIQTGSYENKEGKKVYTTDVIVEEVEFVESKKDSDATGTQKKADEFMDIPDSVSDEGLPFD